MFDFKYGVSLQKDLFFPEKTLSIKKKRSTVMNHSSSGVNTTSIAEQSWLGGRLDYWGTWDQFLLSSLLDYK